MSSLSATSIERSGSGTLFAIAHRVEYSEAIRSQIGCVEEADVSNCFGEQRTKDRFRISPGTTEERNPTGPLQFGSVEVSRTVRLRPALQYFERQKLLPVVRSDNPEQIADEHDQQHSAKPDAGTSADTPPPVTVVSSTQTEDQHQNNYEQKHPMSPFLGISNPRLWRQFDCSGGRFKP